MQTLAKEEKKHSTIKMMLLSVIFYPPVIWLTISSENSHFEPHLQNRFLSKYSVFNILGFISIYVCLSSYIFQIFFYILNILYNMNVNIYM